MNISIQKTINSNNINENDEFFKYREINDEIKEDESFIGNDLILENNIKKGIKKFDSKKLENSNNMSFVIENISSKTIISRNDKIYPNKFINLNSTKENSLQFNSSYENINKMSNNKYINNNVLQNKIKQIIKEECANNLRKKSSVKSIVTKNCLSPTLSPKLKNTRYNSIKINLVADIRENINKCETPILKSCRSLKNIKSLDKKTEHSKKSNSILLESKNNIFSRFKKSENRITNICSPTRIRRKITKKRTNFDVQLNTISKNIKNANNAINNPNEFYLNLFNNIIKKESKIENENKSNEEEEKEEKGKKSGKNLLKIFNNNLSLKNYNENKKK